MSFKKNTHDEIISSAKKLFGNGGFAAVSMSQIAEDVGITKASLYYFFKDKLDIYCAVVEDLINAVGDTFANESIKGKGDAFAKTVEHAIKVSISEGNIFMRLDTGAVHIQGERKEKIHALLRDFFTKVEKFLISYDVNDPKLAAHVLLSSIHTYVKEACMRNSKISPKLFSQYLENLFTKQTNLK